MLWSSAGFGIHFSLWEGTFYWGRPLDWVTEALVNVYVCPCDVLWASAYKKRILSEGMTKNWFIKVITFLLAINLF